MKKFKCILVRTQYQTVLVEATDWGEAVESACDRFDPDLLIENGYVEAYDVKEITNDEQDN